MFFKCFLLIFFQRTLNKIENVLIHMNANQFWGNPKNYIGNIASATSMYVLEAANRLIFQFSEISYIRTQERKIILMRK